MNLLSYFDFEGRFSRTQYWATLIISFIAYLVFAGISAIVIGFSFGVLGISLDNPEIISAFIWIPLFLLLMWVWLATGVKRCRDAGINPLWLLATLIPALSFVAVVVIGVLPTKDK